MISKTGIYGVRAMLALARRPREEYVGAQRIAEQVDVPQSYLSKLLQILARAGLVESQRGVTGGFRLARDPASISLYDIVEPLEPIERWSGCFLGNPECSDQAACVMHDRWRSIQQDYLTMLRKSALDELTSSQSAVARGLEPALGQRQAFLK